MAPWTAVISILDRVKPQSETTGDRPPVFMRPGTNRLRFKSKVTPQVTQVLGTGEKMIHSKNNCDWNYHWSHTNFRSLYSSRWCFFFFHFFFFMHSFSRFALLPEFDVSKVSWSQIEHKKLSSVYRPEKKPDYFIFVTAFVYLFIILLLVCGVKFWWYTAVFQNVGGLAPDYI